jgi:uncharacterized protein (TIGR03437 family)
MGRAVRRRIVLLVAVCLLAAGQQVIQRPDYSAETIVNSADSRAGYLAPNTIATIYGKNLSWTTAAVSPGDIRGGYLPDKLGSARVAVGNLRAPLLYVSPAQINFVIPYILLPGMVEVRVDRDGVAGPNVKVQLGASAPAAYQLDETTVIATHAGGELVDRAHPAAAGEIIVLYVTGLGWTSPPVDTGQLAPRAAQSQFAPKLQIKLDGAAIPREDIFYAGVTPGFSGLYQINFRLPAALPADPEIRLAMEGRESAPGRRLLTRAGP